ncbi:MAG: ankyrin repeat domain-containing protein [Aestuariivirga sp.]
MQFVRTTMSAALCAVLASLLLVSETVAQTPPSAIESSAYQGLHAAARDGDIVALQKLIAQNANLEERDAKGRTPVHVAAFASQDAALQVLSAAGADINALENRAYDVVTIAAVANDRALLDLALNLGASARNVTSPYDGTALIAAAHLGHHQVVKRLIAAGAPLDHVNNLGWTALIEAVILGDGGANHVEIVRALIDAGANSSIADRQGVKPLDYAKARGYTEIIHIIELQGKL